MLGLEVAESTVGKYMVRIRRPPSQGWKTFLRKIMLRELPRSIGCGPHDLLQAAQRPGDLRHAAQQRWRVTALYTFVPAAQT
jgi:hypothetical protein